jgi:hypothetical protein
MKRVLAAAVTSLLAPPVTAVMPVSTSVPALDDGGLLTIVAFAAVARP